MIEPETRRGVLNDWDLCRIRTETGVEHRGGERTGTIPFMAMELLASEGSKPPLYRHDLEGFIWILPWVFLQFDGTKFEVEQLRRGTRNYYIWNEERANMLDYPNIEAYKPSKLWEREWHLAKYLIMWLTSERGEQAARCIPRAIQLAQLKRRRRREEEGEPSYESLRGFFTEEQIKQLKQTLELDYEASKGIDVKDVEECVELAPAEVYNRFSERVSRICRICPGLDPLLSWDHVQGLS